jgi:CRP-like cAMP-binding protein
MMPNDSILAPFTRVPLFSGLSAACLEAIVRRAERVVYQPGDAVQREGDIPDAAILLVSGKAVLVDDPEDIESSPEDDDDVVQPGSLIGELSMLIETRATSTVVARSAVRAFRISRAELRSIMERDPSLAEHFAAKINERLVSMAAEMRRIDKLVAGSMTKIPGNAGSKPHPMH